LLSEVNMTNKRRNLQPKLFWLTVLFFALGLVHISFAAAGVLCFTIPFYYFFRYREKIWCQSVCPRAGFFSRVMSKISLGLKAPKWLTSKRVRDGFEIYFWAGLLVIALSTAMVAAGRVAPIEQVRFLMIFTVPFELPQLLSFDAPPALTHFGYRVYSMMFTTVLIGSALAVLFRPRTWCAVCPVGTLTTGKKKKMV